jgi:hypothetical protein
MEAGVRTHTIETCGSFARSRGMVRNKVVESVRVFFVERQWEKMEAGSNLLPQRVSKEDVPARNGCRATGEYWS